MVDPNQMAEEEQQRLLGMQLKKSNPPLIRPDHGERMDNPLFQQQQRPMQNDAALARPGQKPQSIYQKSMHQQPPTVPASLHKYTTQYNNFKNSVQNTGAPLAYTPFNLPGIDGVRSERDALRRKAQSQIGAGASPHKSGSVEENRRALEQFQQERDEQFKNRPPPNIETEAMRTNKAERDMRSALAPDTDDNMEMQNDQSESVQQVDSDFVESLLKKPTEQIQSLKKPKVTALP